MTSDIGKQKGRLIAAFGESLKLAETVAEGELSSDLLQRRQAKVAAEREMEALRLEMKELDRRSAEANAIATEKENQRWAAPQEFSRARGTFFLALAGLLVLADISIIGQVIARVLRYPWYVEATGKTFTQTLFTDPWKAFTDFPDLLLLSLSVLLIGFFIKAFLDALGGSWSHPAARRRREMSRLLLYGAALVLSLVTLVSMASARGTLDWGGSTPPGAAPSQQQIASADQQPAGSHGPQHRGFSGLVWGLLGVSLPLVSAAFFVKGTECFASWLELERAVAASQSIQERLAELATRERTLEARITDLTGEEEAITAELQRAGHLARRRLEFEVGYREGLIGALFNGDNTVPLLDKLRPVLFEQLRGSATHG